MKRRLRREDRPRRPNMIALMRPAKFRRDIPRKLKEFGWARSINAKGNVRYTQRTWEEMSLDPKHIERFGASSRFRNATLNGEDIGTVWAVPIRIELDLDDIGALGRLRFILISRAQYIAFKEENKI